MGRRSETFSAMTRTLFIFASLFLSGPLSAKSPNILFCISDDQSYAHTVANGAPVVQTPGFDRIAREGLRFTHAFCDAPTCGHSRSAILTGQPIWRLEEAGNIHSALPANFATYTEILKEAGYFVGYTGKGWSPGRAHRESDGSQVSGQKAPAAGHGNSEYRLRGELCRFPGGYAQLPARSGEILSASSTVHKSYAASAAALKEI